MFNYKINKQVLHLALYLVLFFTLLVNISADHHQSKVTFQIYDSKDLFQLKIYSNLSLRLL